MAEFLATFVSLTAIIWFRYAVIAGVFYALLWMRPAHRIGAVRLAEHPPQPDVVRHEVINSAIASAIYAVPGAVTLIAWKSGGTAIYSETDTLLSLIWAPVGVLVYLFLHDTYFYWTHRLMHDPRFYRRIHRTHHRSRDPSPWAAFSFHPGEAILSAWFLPAVAFVLPIHVYGVLFLLVFMTYASVANHAGWEILPQRLLRGRAGEALISASHHHLHHRSHACNYGLYFRFWDRLCKTDHGLSPGNAGPARAPTVARS